MNTNLSQLTTDDLPASLQEYVVALGLVSTLTLVSRYGGTMRLHVPRVIEDDHPLVDSLGKTTAIALVKNYGGSDLYNIPNCKKAIIAVRDRQIFHRYALGETALSLSREYDLTERMIWIILAKFKHADTRQSSLF